MGKAIEREEIEGYTPKVEKAQRGARKTTEIKKRTDGAFGKKKSSLAPTKKKRKVTKRDGFKAFDSAKKSDDKKSKKRGRR